MKNSKTLFKDFMSSITLSESRAEIESIAYLTFENIFGLTKTQILAAQEVADQSLINRLEDVIKRINQHEPIQYILGEALFCDRSFLVNPSVLIPRPETEELVRLVLNYARKRNSNCKVLDIGTGSGCIAVTLAIELPHAEIIAIDVSEDALAVAAANGEIFQTNVTFQKHDILNDKLPFTVDIIISNPPYIARHERDVIPKNVADFEPDAALFVDSGDALMFYRTILSQARESLLPDGLLAVEINERFGNDVFELFKNDHFKEVELLQDMYGKDRIVKGILSS